MQCSYCQKHSVYGINELTEPEDLEGVTVHISKVNNKVQVSLVPDPYLDKFTKKFLDKACREEEIAIESNPDSPLLFCPHCDQRGLTL